MRLLILTFSFLLTSLALAEVPTMPEAQDPDTKLITLPMFIKCGNIAPDQMLEENYGELGMLEGDAHIFISQEQSAEGKLRMFVDPNDRSYTIVFEIGEMSCLVMSGGNITPMVHGKEL